MKKCNLYKIILMMTMFLFLIIAGGCDDGSGGSSGNGGSGNGGGGGTPITPPANPMLSVLYLSIGELTPDFNPAITQYTTIVSSSVNNIIVSLASTSDDVTITVNGENVSNGSSSGRINLEMGSNTITIVVTNSTGQTTYKVTVIRSSQPTYQKISAERARNLMIELRVYTIVDVRTMAEFINKRIPEAMLIPHDEIMPQAATRLPNKDQLIFIYSQADNRSEIATRALLELGYSNVFDMGDIDYWIYETDSGTP